MESILLCVLSHLVHEPVLSALRDWLVLLMPLDVTGIDEVKLFVLSLIIVIIHLKVIFVIALLSEMQLHSLVVTDEGVPCSPVVLEIEVLVHVLDCISVTTGQKLTIRLLSDSS